jgi:hypothetical protein
MVFLKNLKMKLPCDLATPVLGVHIKQLKIESRRHICTPLFRALLFNAETTQWMNG